MIPLRLGRHGEINLSEAGQVFHFRPSWSSTTSRNRPLYIGLHGILATGRLQEPVEYSYIDSSDVYEDDWETWYGEDYYDENIPYSLTSLGATKDEDGWYDNNPFEGDQMWFEVFGAYTVSKLRPAGDCRINTTFGASAVLYPGEDIAPRVFAAVDTDVTRSVKVMAEVFYGAHYPEIQNFDSDQKLTTPFHFDIGFLTNKISFSDNFWMGFHFQRPFISFYWKI